MAVDIVSWFHNRRATMYSSICKLIWRVLFHAITWSLWLETNQGIEVKGKQVERILFDVFHFVWNWIKYELIVRDLIL